MAAKDITITLIQGDSSWPLATADATGGSQLAVEVDIPAEVEPGGATISADSPDLAEAEEIAVEVESADG